MSNKKSAGFSLANQNTISRREWIEKALAGSSEPAGNSGPTAGHPGSPEGLDKPRRPYLYLVVSNPVD
jgi:hypothetical protein